MPHPRPAGPVTRIGVNPDNRERRGFGEAGLPLHRPMTTAFPSGHSSSAFTAFLARDDPLGPANYALAAAELLSEAAKHRHVKTIEIAQDAVRTWLGYVHGCPRLGWDGAGRPMRVVEATE